MTLTDPVVLSARRVTKEFVPGQPALSAVDLDVSRGEWISIMGPSGAGKSTLLQIFAALETPTSGRVLYRGVDLGRVDLDAYRRESVGIVFQLHNLLPHLDVRENLEVAMYGTHLTRRQRTERVDELVHQVDLVDQQWRKPPRLSGGERQRAAIARALVNRPEILLADEPTGSLDPAQVSRLVKLIDEMVTDRRLAVVMVTHDPAVASRAHRQLVLDGGRLAPAGAAGTAPPGPGRTPGSPPVEGMTLAPGRAGPAAQG